MPGLVPGIHVLFDGRERGWPGSGYAKASPDEQVRLLRNNQRETTMPEITVSMAEGRTDEQKAGMMRDITQALVKNLGVDADAVVIQINEAPLRHKMKGGKTFVERAAAAKK
jgi:4-oxalocrotonate tautomerase